MFKAALSSLSSSIFSTVKDTVNEYRPSTSNVTAGVFNNLAQQGIANLSYRSPILASLAQSALQNFQLELLKKQKLQEYVKSDKADWLRSPTREKMGKDTSTEKIEAEMMKIISKMSDAIDKEGVEAAKKSGKFKEYEKFFEEFKKSKSEPALEASQQSTEPVNNDSAILTRIEGNTNRTVNVLEELAVQNFGRGTSVAPEGNKRSFIDPMTGMPSISAAVGSVGGDILSKIFDENTINKISDKVKSIFSGLGNTVTSVKPKTTETVLKEKAEVLRSETVLSENSEVVKPETVKPIQSGNTTESTKEQIANINLFSANMQKTADESLGELKKISVAVEKQVIPTSPDKESTPKTKTNRSTRESAVDKTLKTTQEKIATKPQARIPKGQPGAGRFTKVIESVTPNKLTTVAETAGKGILPTATRTVGATAARVVGGSLLGGLGSLVSGTVGTLAAGAAGVAAAGAGGYMLGSKVLNPLINKGISAATGKDNTLGGWIYDKMHPETKDAVIPKRNDKLQAVKSTDATQIKKLTDIKTKQDIAKSTPQAPQIVALNSNSSAQTSASQGQSLIVGTSIRNTDSTFERVQMQDFWPRTS